MKFCGSCEGRNILGKLKRWTSARGFQLLFRANSEVAKNIIPDSYGLIFGFTTLMALVLQTLLTIVVIEYLSLQPKSQFLVYGGYFAVLGCIFALKNLIDLIYALKRDKSAGESIRQTSKTNNEIVE